MQKEPVTNVSLQPSAKPALDARGQALLIKAVANQLMRFLSVNVDSIIPTVAPKTYPHLNESYDLAYPQSILLFPMRAFQKTF